MCCGIDDDEPVLTRLAQNIDFQTTILSRFDMIFIVKDEHDEARDRVSFVQHTQMRQD